MASQDHNTTPSWLRQGTDSEDRQQRGLALAASNKVRVTSTGYRVRAQSKNGYYQVNSDASVCTCPDFAERQKPCKHVFAVKAFLAVSASAAPVVQLVTQVTQVTQVAGTPPPARRKRGRPRKNVADAGPGLEQRSFFDHLQPVAGTPAPSRKAASGPESPEDSGPAAIPTPPKAPKPKPKPFVSGLLAGIEDDLSNLDTPMPRATPPPISMPENAFLGAPVFITGAKGLVIPNPDAGLTQVATERPAVRPVGDVGEALNSRNYANYNQALQTQKAGFTKLLAQLCDGIEEAPQRMGRPKMPLADMIFAATYKVFTRFSLRRFNTDLQQAHDRGYVSRKPQFNTIS